MVLQDAHTVFGCDIQPVTNARYFQVEKENPTYDKVFESEVFDLCINCSGSASVQLSVNNPVLDFSLNVSNLVRLLSALHTHNPQCRLINISSAAVYGNPKVLPVKVGDPTSPLSPYGVHKLIADSILNEYYKLFKISSCSVRVFSAYGNGQKKLFLWDCVQKILDATNESPAKFFGTGWESRDYIHISDVIQQVELVIKNASFEGEIYNIANGEEVHINHLVNLVQSSLNTHKNVVFTGNERTGDPLNWKADIQQMLEWGYQKKVPIEEGVGEYTRWAVKNLMSDA